MSSGGGGIVRRRINKGPSEFPRIYLNDDNNKKPLQSVMVVYVPIRLAPQKNYHKPGLQTRLFLNNICFFSLPPTPLKCNKDFQRKRLLLFVHCSLLDQDSKMDQQVKVLAQWPEINLQNL